MQVYKISDNSKTTSYRYSRTIVCLVSMWKRVAFKSKPSAAAAEYDVVILRAGDSMWIGAHLYAFKEADSGFFLCVQRSMLFFPWCKLEICFFCWCELGRIKPTIHQTSCRLADTGKLNNSGQCGFSSSLVHGVKVYWLIKVQLLCRGINSQTYLW